LYNKQDVACFVKLEFQWPTELIPLGYAMHGDELPETSYAVPFYKYMYM